jgi:hypothetical protein
MVLKTSTKAALGASAIFGTIAAFGYMYYTGKLDCFFETRVQEKSNDKKKKKKRTSTLPSVSLEEIPESSSRISVDKSTNNNNIPAVKNPDPIVLPSKSKKSEPKAISLKKPSRLIDLPVDEIMKLPPEQREQVFYAILIEGENLLNKGNIKSFS